MNSTNKTPFAVLKEKLTQLATVRAPGSYSVPSTWCPLGETPKSPFEAVSVHPGPYFLQHVSAIETHRSPDIDPTRSLNGQISGGNGGNWITREVIYNLFVRLSTAYDHDEDGTIGGGKDPTLNSSGIRETGTFLKAIALLGHIKRLGATTIHLLPVTAIGKDGNKGVLGSPYAIRDPYKLDPAQADPLLDMTVEDQCKAFIEACHMLGIRVICEFVFRTAAKDSDWIQEHPEWFYWIDDRIEDRKCGEARLDVAKKQYGNPIFEDGTLALIKRKVDRNEFTDLPAPPEEFRGFFTLPPEPAEVRKDQYGRYRALTVNPVNGEKLTARIPGAFADWPPDDNQPPWGDVTYLRMYNDETPSQPHFNYIAYNTIRMYDQALARDDLANRPLWEKISDLIPFYQHEYGIDGVMVDMGHAVPVKLMQEIVQKARSVDSDFAFLSENFAIDESSVQAGYNSVVGYAWWVEYHRDGMANLLQHVGVRGVPISFFGAVENHNTPRAAGRPGGIRYAKYAFIANTFLPRAVPFIHAGFELGESRPVNTGLDFKDEDLERFRTTPLPLFDISGYQWLNDHQMIDFVTNVLRIRRDNLDAVSPAGPESFVLLETGCPDVFAFLRRGGGKILLVLFNRDAVNYQSCRIDLQPYLSTPVSSLNNLLPSESRPTLILEKKVFSSRLEAGETILAGWSFSA
jgi:glycosidase